MVSSNINQQKRVLDAGQLFQSILSCLEWPSLFSHKYFIVRVKGVFVFQQNLTFDHLYLDSSKNEIKEDHSKCSKVDNLNLHWKCSFIDQIGWKFTTSSLTYQILTKWSLDMLCFLLPYLWPDQKLDSLFMPRSLPPAMFWTLHLSWNPPYMR